MVGKITFGTGGGDDTFELYRFEDGDDLSAPGTAFSTVSADLDESSWNTVTMGNNRGSGYDEIRIGTTFADVVPVPEPSSTALLGLGSLALVMRRRR